VYCRGGELHLLFIIVLLLRSLFYVRRILFRPSTVHHLFPVSFTYSSFLPLLLAIVRLSAADERTVLPPHHEFNCYDFTLSRRFSDVKAAP
jgi:hypothetical protein